MTKITFIGAGSTVFAKNILSDILGFPEQEGIDDHLVCSINEKRLREDWKDWRKNGQPANLGVNPTLEITTDGRLALEGGRLRNQI